MIEFRNVLKNITTKLVPMVGFSLWGCIEAPTFFSTHTGGLANG